MLLQLPSNLHYPITITKVRKKAGETINLKETLFLYKYTTKVTYGDRYTDEETEHDEEFLSHFESTLEGTIKRWQVWDGDVISGPMEVCEIIEECTHSVQYLGMCTNCGKDMTQMQPGSAAGTERANIQAAHDTDKLTISQDEANQVDEESKKRLLSSRKLSLVVDLDQTIIHAAVDPTIGEWMKDPENPNYEALKDVRFFQLVDDGPGMRGCWYYIKMRPGLQSFLDQVSEKYELHIYTMGTRQYAQQIAHIVDPQGKYFGDRILSRDESGSMVAKNLTRIFPVDTRMVVIIDDRGDVWKWSPNLIRVSAFDFFVGIGDINAGFLPKKQDIPATAKPEKKAITEQPETNGSKENENGEHPLNGEIKSTEDAIAAADTSALQQLVAMSGSDDAAVQELQSKTQEEAIASQLEDKPLLKLQQQMDEKDGVDTNPTEPATQGTDSDSESSDSSTANGKPRARHSILRDDDEELIHLEQSLSNVHERFFAEYDRRRQTGKGGRVAALSGKRKVALSGGEDETFQADLQLVPDVKKVMPQMKARVFDGVSIVFSGVLPLGTDIQTADISVWAKSFGASITDKVTKDVTHVIAARVGTAKVKAAVKRGIKVVGTDWLMHSIQKWKKLDERPYLLPGIGQKEMEEDQSSEIGAHDLFDDRRLVMAHEYLLSSSDGESSSFEDTDEDQPRKKRLRLDINAAENADGEEFVDDGSPVTINQGEWDEIDAEFKEFMGDDMDSGSETESVKSDRSLAHRERRSQKRRRGEDDSDDSGLSDVDRERSSKVRNTGSTLKAVANIDSSASNTPMSVRDSGGTRQAPGQDEEDSDDELARELERELEEAP